MLCCLDSHHKPFPTSVHLLWCVRDFKLVDFFLNYLVSMLQLRQHSRPQRVRVKICLTGVAKASVKTMAFNAFMALHFNRVGSCFSADSAGRVTISMGRPDIGAEVAKWQGAGGTASSVYYCGSARLARCLSKTCEELEVPFVKEEFQNRTLGKLCGI